MPLLLHGMFRERPCWIFDLGINQMEQKKKRRQTVILMRILLLLLLGSCYDCNDLFTSVRISLIQCTH